MAMHSEIAAMLPATPPMIAAMGSLEVEDEVVADWDAAGAVDEVAAMEEVVCDVDAEDSEGS